MDEKFGWWFAGFVDGEGCFEIHPVGEYFICRFIIGLRADDQPLLEEIKTTLGLGEIRIQVMNNGARAQARWAVERKAEVGQLVPVFDAFPLRSKKAQDFKVWREAVAIWLTAKRGSRWHGRSPHTAELGRLRDELRAIRRFAA